MMKKLLSLVLALALCPLLALAEDTGAEALTYQELMTWAEGYAARALAATPLNDPAQSKTADGYEFIYDFGTVYADTPTLDADTVLSAVVLTAMEEDAPRGVNVSASLEEVLGAHYSENDLLAGSREAAVLYAVDQLPEGALWGQVNRDGQRVQTIQYAVHEQLPTGGEGYSDAGIIYTMAENRVSAVRIYGLNSRISLDEVNDVMYRVMLGALEETYTQVPFSYAGEELTTFGVQDLSFSGLDFLHLEAETAIDTLGKALSDEWMEDGETGYIRVLTYADCELIYLYNRAKTQGTLYMLVIHADGLEGPRAVRCGDAFSSVYNRFRNGEGEYQEDGSEVLYGTADEGAFGTARYGYNADATLRYGFDAPDGRKVVLQMEFEQMVLTEVLLYAE